MLSPPLIQTQATIAFLIVLGSGEMVGNPFLLSQGFVSACDMRMLQEDVKRNLRVGLSSRNLFRIEPVPTRARCAIEETDCKVVFHQGSGCLESRGTLDRDQVSKRARYRPKCS